MLDKGQDVSQRVRFDECIVSPFAGRRVLLHLCSTYLTSVIKCDIARACKYLLPGNLAMRGVGPGLDIGRISRCGSDVGFMAGAGVERGKQRGVLATVSASASAADYCLIFSTANTKVDIDSAQGFNTLAS